MTTICLASCSILCWSLGGDLKIHHASTTKMLWKKPHPNVISSQENYKLQLLKEPVCTMKSSPALKLVKLPKTDRQLKMVSQNNTHTHYNGLSVPPLCEILHFLIGTAEPSPCLQINCTTACLLWIWRITISYVNQCNAHRVFGYQRGLLELEAECLLFLRSLG